MPTLSVVGRADLVKLRENPKPSRRYPWGTDPDPNRANYVDAKVGEQSATGCFPGGVSPLGCEEMSGNVWEWTRNLWGKSVDKDYKYPYSIDDGREDIAEGSPRVVRGGVFWFERSAVRAAYRFRFVARVRHINVGFRVVLSPFTSGL